MWVYQIRISLNNPQFLLNFKLPFHFRLKVDLKSLPRVLVWRFLVWRLIEGFPLWAFKLLWLSPFIVGSTGKTWEHVQPTTQPYVSRSSVRVSTLSGFVTLGGRILSYWLERFYGVKEVLLCLRRRVTSNVIDFRSWTPPPVCVQVSRNLSCPVATSTLFSDLCTTFVLSFPWGLNEDRVSWWTKGYVSVGSLPGV